MYHWNSPILVQTASKTYFIPNKRETAFQWIQYCIRTKPDFYGSDIAHFIHAAALNGMTHPDRVRKTWPTVAGIERQRLFEDHGHFLHVRFSSGPVCGWHHRWVGYPKYLAYFDVRIFPDMLQVPGMCWFPAREQAPQMFLLGVASRAEKRRCAAGVAMLPWAPACCPVKILQWPSQTWALGR